MRRAWLLKRRVYLGCWWPYRRASSWRWASDWNRIAAHLNGNWRPWVSNVANVVQIGSPAIALLALWLTKVARSHSAAPAGGAAARVLRLLALLLPARDRDRFVREVVANMADRQRWWQRLEELLSVAAAVPGLAVILRCSAGGLTDRLAQPAH